jgi:hypothetical protein
VKRGFIASHAFRFANTVCGHEEPLVVLRSRGEKFQMFDIQFAPKIAGNRIEGFELMLLAILQLCFDFCARW